MKYETFQMWMNKLVWVRAVVNFLQTKDHS